MQLNKKEYLKSLLKQILSEAEIDDKDVIEGFQSYLENDDAFKVWRSFKSYDPLSYPPLLDILDNYLNNENSKNSDEILLNTPYHKVLMLIEEEMGIEFRLPSISSFISGILLLSIPDFKLVGLIKQHLNNGSFSDITENEEKDANEIFLKTGKKIKQIAEEMQKQESVFWAALLEARQILKNIKETTKRLEELIRLRKIQ